MILVNGAVRTPIHRPNAAARASDCSSRELDDLDIRHQFALAAAVLVAGLAYVAIGAYWALGGTLAHRHSQLLAGHRKSKHHRGDGRRAGPSDRL